MLQSLANGGKTLNIKEVIVKIKIDINKKEFGVLYEFISEEMYHKKLPHEVEEILRRTSNGVAEREKALWNPGDPFDQ